MLKRWNNFDIFPLKSNPYQWSIVFTTAAAVLFISNIVFIMFGTAEIQPWNTPSDLHLQLEKVGEYILLEAFSSRKINIY